MATRRMRAVRILAVALFTWVARGYQRARRRRPVLNVSHGGPYGHVAAWRRRDAARRMHVLRLPARRAGPLAGDGA